MAKRSIRKKASRGAASRSTTTRKAAASRKSRTPARPRAASAKSTPPPAGRKRSATAQGLRPALGASELPDEDKPLPKTRLTDKQLREFREMLLKIRAEIVGDVELLTDEALNRKQGPGASQSSMPIHMADLGTDTWEQEFTLGLIASEQSRVREIDDALERIEARTYGVCLATHGKIRLNRLRAKPWAKYCIEYARLRDEGRGP